jgi:hypothetical protein
MRFMAEVSIIGGGLPGFLGASCSVSVFFAPVASVADVGTGLVTSLVSVRYY